MESSVSASSAKVCRCGHARGHVMVSPEGDYSVLGWFLLLVGISAKPKVIRYRCRVCTEVVELTRDPRELEETRID